MSLDPSVREIHPIRGTPRADRKKTALGSLRTIPGRRLSGIRRVSVRTSTDCRESTDALADLIARVWKPQRT